MKPSNTVSSNISQLKDKLYKQFVFKSEYSKHNKDRIDWVLKNVYRRQIKTFNKNEQKVFMRLVAHNIKPQVQQVLPILSSGGKLEHLYIADIIVGKTIIEVDGPQHEDQKEWDEERDRLTSEQGYTTIRIPTSDLSNETIDNYLRDLY